MVSGGGLWAKWSLDVVSGTKSSLKLVSGAKSSLEVVSGVVLVNLG